MSLIKFAVILMNIILCTTGRRLIRSAEEEGEENFNLNEDWKNTTCIARNNQQGLCVPEIYCNEDHTVLPGGDIHRVEIRSIHKTPCNKGLFEWCCTIDNIIQFTSESSDIEHTTLTTTDVSSTPGPTAIASTKLPPPGIENKQFECTAPIEDVCPFCVSVHRRLTRTITTTGLFCMGSMIGPKLVLTSGNCIKTSQMHIYWVRVPSSIFPHFNHTVSDRLLHPNYNSGSHENDFGILVLKDDVNWKEDQWVGACLGLFTPFEAYCVGFGFDAEEDIVSTLITVKRKGCNGTVKTSDAMCGTTYDKQDECIITAGSPIMCPSDGDGLVVAGIARGSCTSNWALLGSLELSSHWLSETLNTMEVTSEYYTYNL